MAFDPIFVKGLLDEVVEKGKKVSEEVGSQLDNHAKRREEHLTGEITRKNSISKQKNENLCNVVNTASNALNTAADIYSKISTSINATKETQLKIEKSRHKFENDKRKLDKEFEKMRLKYENELKQTDNSHEEKMKKIENAHEQNMSKIQIVREYVNGLLDILKSLAIENPGSPVVSEYIGQLNTAMLSLNSSTSYLEEKS